MGNEWEYVRHVALGVAVVLVIVQWGLWINQWWAARQRRTLFSRTHHQMKELCYRIRFGQKTSWSPKERFQ